jgi:iron(III) transport system substrate-binding protein
VAALSVVLTLAAACAGGSGEVSDAGLDAGVDAGELVIYSGRSESLVGPIIEQFERATGVDVSVKYGSTGEIAATLLEEGKNTPADVFFAQDPGGLGAVAAAGMLGTVPDEVLMQVPDWARSPDGLWVGISGRARTVVYNTETVDPSQLPATLEGFTDPIWRGRIGWAPTNGSFQAMVTAIRVLWGEERTRVWLEGMQANDPTVYPKNTPIVAATAAGEVEVGLVNHYYLHRFLAEQGEGFTARNHHLSGGGPGTMVLVAGAGILTDADNGANAELFLDFLLSTVSQQYFAAQTFEYPLVEGVTLSRLITSATDINIPNIDMADLADLSGTQRMLRELGIIP